MSHHYAFQLHECLLNKRECNSKMVANAVCRRALQREMVISSCLTIISIVHSFLHLQTVSQRIGKQRSQVHAMQVAISAVLLERARLPL